MAKDDVTVTHSIHRKNRPDPHHEQQLLRDLQTINAATARALGPLPLGGLPIQPKRKPQLPLPAVPAATPAPSVSDEDTPMQWKNAAAVAALATGTALAACGADGDTSGSTNPSPAVVDDAPGSVEVTPVKAVPQPAEDAHTKPETAAEQPAAEPERGPAIPAAQLRRQILELLGSFKTLEDLERGNVEKMLHVHLHRNPRMTEGYKYGASTTEGWNYSISVDKLARLDQPSTILIGLDHGVEPFSGQEPTYCTLEFEPLAKELVAMGYEQAEGPYQLKGKTTWWFERSTHPDGTSATVGVGLYELQSGQSAQTCVLSLKVGGNANE